jgi:hypothetical protein
MRWPSSGRYKWRQSLEGINGGNLQGRINGSNLQGGINQNSITGTKVSDTFHH